MVGVSPSDLQLLTPLHQSLLLFRLSQQTEPVLNDQNLSDSMSNYQDKSKQVLSPTKLVRGLPNSPEEHINLELRIVDSDGLQLPLTATGQRGECST